MKQGQMSLVLIAAASAGALQGCGPLPDGYSTVASVDETPQLMQRAAYATVEDCARDWGSAEDCEVSFDPEGMDKVSPSAAGGTVVAHPHTTWWGPYYSNSGQVYRYDGRVDRVDPVALRPSRVVTQSLSPAGVYATPSGRYATTVAHPSAGSAKVAAIGRGGFGAAGRGGSGGG